LQQCQWWQQQYLCQSVDYGEYGDESDGDEEFEQSGADGFDDYVHVYGDEYGWYGDGWDECDAVGLSACGVGWGDDTDGIIAE
jgi:hypothetical protein